MLPKASVTMHKTEISFFSTLSYFTAYNKKKGKKKLIKFTWSVSNIVKISVTTLIKSKMHVGEDG